MGRDDRPAAAGTTVVPAKLRVPAPSGLVRTRLLDKLGDAAATGFGTVIGPAGSGKTTSLAQFLASVDGPAAWYRAEESDGRVESLLAYLERALCASLGGLAGGWQSVEEMAADLDGWSGRQAFLVVDDFHALEGTPAEGFVKRLAEYAPSSLAVLLASRRQPRFNVSRRRIEGRLTELSSDDLRFRSWEVERLFKDVYREPLSPQEVAEVTSRTEGWPAVLQLFHLATSGRTPARRRQTLGALSVRSRLVREYLARNILEQLPGELRRFLLDTCVLPRLSGPLCDAFLECSGSDKQLDQIERRRLLLVSLDDGSYRYHEVLRSYLESVLVTDVGEAETSALYGRAGRLLEEATAYTDAIRAYARAEDHQAISRLLGSRGEDVVAAPGTWVEKLSSGVVESDPWLLLARARRSLACGRVDAALSDYRRAEVGFGAAGGADIARVERMALGAWTIDVSAPRMDWLGLVREATRRDPLGASARARDGSVEHGDLAAGLAALLGGHVRDAERFLVGAAGAEASSPRLAAVASFAAAVAQALAGGRPVEGLADGRETFEELGQPWLAQLCQAVLETVLPDAERDASAAPADDWGRALAAVVRAGVGGPEPGTAETLVAAAGVFRSAGARVLEAWAVAHQSLVEALEGGTGAHATALAAERLARTTGTRGAAVVAYRALALTDPAQRTNHTALAAAIAEECGLRSVAPVPGDGGTGRPSIVVRCFGAFRMDVGGEPVDLQSVKPRVRSLLRLLAIDPGRLVHWEALVEALWPEASPSAGKRSLQVAVSAARQLLDPGAPRDSSLLTRVGDAYCLTLPDDAHVDVAEFAALARQARIADGMGDRAAALAAAEAALSLYGGDLLSEEGPAEWVLKAREGHRSTAADLTEMMAGISVAEGAYAAAAHACQRGLEIDSYRDGLWRTLVGAYQASGDHAAAGRAGRDYAAVLSELGVGDVGHG
ncbi:MAG: hypothetical protein QOD63_256 [Actinomycetota bacterium]|nr:hypothetical protein [Actinomycetota bacterium]